MSSNDNYANHLRMLEIAKENLLKLKLRMHEMQEAYKHQIDIAESTGFMTNYTDPLKEKYQRFSQKIDDMAYMADRHNMQIEQQEEVIQHLMQIANNE